jgi:hypothetical protein
MSQCFYETIAECRPHVLGGNRGFCQHNPYYQAAAPQYYRHAPPGAPPGGGRWRYIGNGNYVGE